MPNEKITPIVMPRWGLSMAEGKVTRWLTQEGAPVRPGEAIIEVETDKIAGAVEAGEGGILRLCIAKAQALYPVRALLGVIAQEGVSDDEIRAFVEGYAVPAADEAEEDDAEQYHFADLGIGRIRYARRGEGRESLLLIHGFGGDLDNWVLNMDAFGDIATVYAFDLPGHGRSTKAMPQQPVEGLAGTVFEFMDRLGLDAAHVAGHSLGGLIGILMAKQAARRVKSLTLICSAGLGAKLNDGFLMDFIAAESIEDLRSALELLFADPNQLSRPMMDELLVYKRTAGVAEALRALHDDMVENGAQRRILAGELKGLEMPVLAIAGRLDRIIPPRQTYRLRKNVQVALVREAGHMVPMEKYKTVNQLLRKQIATAG